MPDVSQMGQQARQGCRVDKQDTVIIFDELVYTTISLIYQLRIFLVISLIALRAQRAASSRRRIALINHTMQ